MDAKLNADVRKHVAGEPDKFKAQSSNESVASAIFPWRVRRNETRRPVVSRTETGRTISTAGFYMCMMSVMLLTTGIGLAAASGWTLIYRIPYVYLSGGSIFLGADGFTLIAGVLSFPSCWIAWMCHNNKKYYTALPVLMVLLSFTVCVLSTGVGLGFASKSKLGGQRYRTILTQAMVNYDANSNVYWSWNSVQKRLRCCGVNGAGDWFKYRKFIPSSCYTKRNTTSGSKTPFVRSCLDALSSELSWEVCFLIGVGLIGLSVKILTLVLVTSVYVHHRRSGSK